MKDKLLILAFILFCGSSLAIVNADNNIAKDTIGQQTSDNNITKGSYVMITADGLNVREEASINSKVIASVYKDRVYEVVDIKQDKHGDDWFLIYKNYNLSGWIASWYTKSVDENYLGIYEGKSVSGTSDVNYNPFIISSFSAGWPTFEGYLFGGYYNDEWYTLEDFEIYEINNRKTIDLVKGDETYTVCSRDKVIGKFNGNYPVHDIDYTAGVKFDTFNYDMSQFEDYKLIVGVSGDWNPLPRVPEITDDGKTITLDIDGDGKKERIEIRECCYEI